MTTTQFPRPWLKIHPKVAHGEGSFKPRFDDTLSLFRNAVAVSSDKAAIHYFDSTLTYAQVDQLSSAFASELIRLGVKAGDRVALYMQNIPQYVICLVGAWKAEAMGVSINPMNRTRELKLLLEDSGARVLVMQRDLYQDVAKSVLQDIPNVTPITTSVREFQSRNDPRLIDGEDIPAFEGILDLSTLLAQPVACEDLRGSASADQPAMIVYTSGTTGVPKGAIITHANMAIDAELWRAWVDVRDGAPILAIAPLFHITGLVGHIGFAFSAASPLILSLRFHPEVVADAAHEYKAEFVVGAITAFIAMMNHPTIKPCQFKSLKRIFSGGAPVPAAVAAEFAKKFGVAIRNCYGLTESSSLAVGVPPACDTPTDANGAFSIGVPVFDTDVFVAGESGQPLPLGQVGEIMMRGPQILQGYWQRSKETGEALTNGFLHTGDVGYMDEAGWLYLVDRKKDMISASGYKVWPKEVEDVIYTHPSIKEVAVVGVPDGYRGETVKAVVSLKPGQHLEAAELIDFCKERMAAYKYPRQVEFVQELPKTLTGKILRRELRPN